MGQIFKRVQCFLGVTESTAKCTLELNQGPFTEFSVRRALTLSGHNSNSHEAGRGYYARGLGQLR